MQDGISSERDWRDFFPAGDAEFIGRMWGPLSDRELEDLDWLSDVCLCLWCPGEFDTRWQAAASLVMPEGCPGLCGAFCLHAIERKYEVM